MPLSEDLGGPRPGAPTTEAPGTTAPLVQFNGGVWLCCSVVGSIVFVDFTLILSVSHLHTLCPLELCQGEFPLKKGLPSVWGILSSPLCPHPLILRWAGP